MDRVCPLLGLSGDRRAVVDGVDGSHRCHAERPPETLERTMQAQLCLTPAHERCERFTAYVARTGARTPGRSAVADGFVSTRLVLSPQPAWRGIAGRAGAVPRTPIVAVGAGVVALGVGAAAVAGGMLGSGPELTVASATPTPTAEATPTPPTPAPTPTAVATASPTLAPTPTPTPSAVPTVPPPAQQTYVVQEGDTLAAIAQRFGTTVEAVQAANGIEDPNEITVGDVLVIP